jgi:hypothetical protein
VSEFAYVQHPAVYPQCCVICQGSNGPLVDTFGQNALGRIYICGLCVKRSARALGLIEGDRMEQLLNHGALLDQAAKELTEREELVNRQATDLAAQTRKIEALEELLQQERDRAATHKHLAEMIQEHSRQLVNGGSA